MKASRFSESQKVVILKQGKDGMPVADIFRKAGNSQATYFNWKKKYDGLLPTEMRRLKQFDDENSKLRRVVADLSLDKEIDRFETKRSSVTGSDGRRSQCRHVGIAGRRPGRQCGLNRPVVQWMSAY